MLQNMILYLPLYMTFGIQPIMANFHIMEEM